MSYGLDSLDFTDSKTKRLIQGFSAEKECEIKEKLTLNI